jgi:hypothetical protein
MSTREGPRPWAYDLANLNLSCGRIEIDRIKVRSVRCLQECAYIITFAGFYWPRCRPYSHHMGWVLLNTCLDNVKSLAYKSIPLRPIHTS